MNKKGFTLIELLAVIVILAVIALIATPIILSLVQESRDNSLNSNMKNYINALDDAAIYGQMGLGASKIAEGIYLYSEIEEIDGISFSGEAPSDGWIAINSDLRVVAGMLYFKELNRSKYAIYYNKQTVIKSYIDSPSTIGSAPLSVEEGVLEAATIVNE